MDTKTILVNNNEYIFLNSFRGNRSGFVHETELLCNNWMMGKNKVQYYNRTWERYTYQTVMKGCVRNLMENIMEEFKTDWKKSHDIKRLTKAKHEAMMKDFENNPPMDYLDLKEVYSLL